MIERAPGGRPCVTCGRDIERRELIGRATGGDPYCTGCVTTTRPPRDFRPADARAEEEFLAARNQPRTPKPVAKAAPRQTAARAESAKPKAIAAPKPAAAKPKRARPAA